MKKKGTAALVALLMAASMVTACAAGTAASGSGTGTVTTTTAATATTTTAATTTAATGTEAAGTAVTAVQVSADGAIDAAELFSNRDLTQEADLSGASYITVQDGTDVSITAAGVYVLSGTAREVTVVVEAGDEDKVQLVLDGLSLTNSDSPCIYVKNADKVFVTTTATENSLSVTGSFTADGSTKTDAVIFSKDDLVLNGLGTLTVSSSDNGISGKDDLKITGGTLFVTAQDCGIEANDSIAVAGGAITVTAANDALHAENDDDQSLGYIYICGGSLTLTAGDDALHATTICQVDGGEITVVKAGEGIEATWVQINGGTVSINATDDGINAASKSKKYSVLFEMNDGYLTIVMGAGDTDGIDSNGDIVITGGTIDITGQSSFDYDGTATYTGGTIIVNGEETNTITNQFMGGQGGGFGGFGGQGGQGGQGGGFGGGPGGGHR